MDNGSISQDTLSKAGLAPSDMAYRDLMQTYGKRDDAMKQSAESAAKIPPLQQAKADALAPKLDEAAAAAREKPPEAPKLERSPDYQRPTVKPQEFQDQFGMMLAASMLMGIGSRQPFFDAMSGLTGAMKGYQAKDEVLVKDSLAAFDRNLGAIKERNDAARLEFDEAWKKYANNLPRLKQEIEILSAKYDMPIAAENARHASIDSVVKTLDGQIKSAQTAYEKAQSLSEKIRHDMALEAEAKARREDAAAFKNVMLSMKKDAAGTGGLSEKYKTDPEYQKNVNYWAKYMADGNTLPPRFAQSGAGKMMMPDILNVVPTLGGGDPADMAANKLTLRQLTAEAQKLGTQSAAVSIANAELARFIPLAEKAIDNVPRTAWQPLNRLIQAGENTWSPEQRKLVVATRSVQNAYAQLIQRGAPTVHSLSEAEKMINSADSPAAYKAVMSQLMAEGEQAEEGLKDAHEAMQKRAKNIGKPREAEKKTPTGNNTPDEQKEMEELERKLGVGGAVKGKITPR